MVTQRSEPCGMAAGDVEIIHRHFLAGQAAMLFPPCTQREQDREEVLTLVGQVIFVAGRALAVGPALHEPVSFELLQSRSGHLRCCSAQSLNLIKPMISGE